MRTWRRESKLKRSWSVSCSGLTLQASPAKLKSAVIPVELVWMLLALAGTGVAVAIALRAAATPAARLRTAIVEGATAGIDGKERGPIATILEKVKGERLQVGLQYVMQVHVDQVTFQAFKRNGHRVLVPANPYSLRCPQLLPGHSRVLTGRSSCRRGSGHDEYRHIEAKAAGRGAAFAGMTQDQVDQVDQLMCIHKGFQPAAAVAVAKTPSSHVTLFKEPRPRVARSRSEIVKWHGIERWLWEPREFRLIELTHSRDLAAGVKSLGLMNTMSLQTFFVIISASSGTSHGEFTRTHTLPSTQQMRQYGRNVGEESKDCKGANEGHESGVRAQNVGNGVARSLARVQNMRLAVKCTPRMPTKSGRNITTSNPTVPADEPHPGPTAFGNVDLDWYPDLGISSAMKTKPSLVYPVEFTHSFQTDALVAYPLPVTPGMTAQTMIEMTTPAKRKNSPACSILGNARLANKTIAVKTQVAMTYVTKTCQRSVAKPGCDTAYMLEIPPACKEADPAPMSPGCRGSRRRFHVPPPADGMADASSAIDAATNQYNIETTMNSHLVGFKWPKRGSSTYKGTTESDPSIASCQGHSDDGP
ncbi:hypothetical protein KC366_g23 [Hortaea werneckii]|nr:hypothetical protein KC366_g23 [Hortaea werneckii]